MSKYKLNERGIEYVNDELSRVKGGNSFAVLFNPTHYDKVMCQAEEAASTGFASSRENVSRYEESRSVDSNKIILSREFFDGSILVNDFINNTHKYCEKAGDIWRNI